MVGETVTVERLGESYEDAMGETVYGESELTEVSDVLVQPGGSSDISDSTRPNGVLVRYTLHFPKSFNEDLTGARILVRGEWHDVIGSPSWYTADNTPTRWNYPVEVKRVDG